MSSFFEERFGVTEAPVERALGELLGGSVGEADLFFEHATVEALALEDGTVKSAQWHLRQGVGCRCVSGMETGYAFTESFGERDILAAARAARAIAQGGRHPGAVRIQGGPVEPTLYAPLPFDAFGTLDTRVKLLREVDEAARGCDRRVVQVLAGLTCEIQQVQIVRADGSVARDSRPMIRFHLTCVAEEGARRESGSDGAGGRAGLDLLTEGGRHLAAAREAARLAVGNLHARETPAGFLTVVLGPGSPGILLHEAIGHGLEADFNRRGTSAFSGRIGERVASPLCTVVDDGRVPQARGSLHVDDEGTPSSRNVLIENGVLRAYLQDGLNARLLGMKRSGNARRQNFRFAPMPRMTSTYMLAGSEDPADIVRSVDRGVYFAKFGSGEVDITSGNFVFSSSEARLIEGGRLTAPLKDATLVGNGPEILKRVTRVGSDLALDSGLATCGKDGQGVPVNTGLPTVRIDGITVGGTGR